jgi:uncharacterized protein YecT (DUF1311 family)
VSQHAEACWLHLILRLIRSAGSISDHPRLPVDVPGRQTLVDSIPDCVDVELESLENRLNTTFQEIYVDSPIRLDFIH